MNFRLAVVVLLLSVVAFPSVVTAETNAPEFLTARQPAKGATVHPPDTWSATENVAWKLDIPGLAWCSPVVWDDKIFLTTCINTGEGRAPKKGLYLQDVDANKYPKETNPHIYKVLCIDLESGTVIWEQVAHEGIPAKPHHIKNTLASETCATDGERLYAMFGNLGLFCYTLDGEPVWQYEIEPRETRMGWGTSMSPVVHEDRVYVVNDNEEDSWLIALDKHTGEEVWKVPRETPTNYSTPFVWENPLRTEIVINGQYFARSYDLDGNELWRVEGKSALAIPRPFEKFGLLYVISGHVVFGENRTYAIRPGASGDISPRDDQPTSEYLAWYTKTAPYHPTPLIVDGLLYMLLDRGFMMCYDAKTGEEIYGKQRIPGGRAFTSSPWTYDDKIFCLNEDGVTFVTTTGPEFEVLHENPLAEDDMGMATPVVIDDKLLIRTSSRLYCIAEDK